MIKLRRGKSNGDQTSEMNDQSCEIKDRYSALREKFGIIVPIKWGLGTLTKIMIDFEEIILREYL